MFVTAMADTTRGAAAAAAALALVAAVACLGSWAGGAHRAGLLEAAPGGLVFTSVSCAATL